MKIQRQKFFSDSEDGGKKISDSLKNTLLFGTLSISGTALGRYLFNLSDKIDRDPKFLEKNKTELDKLNKVLESEADKLNIKIDRTKREIPKPNKTGIKFIDKYLDKSYKRKVQIANSPGYFPDLKRIRLGDNINPGSFSHEVGHAFYNSPGWKGKIVGKTAHKAYTATGGQLNPLLQTIIALRLAKKSGKDKAREEVLGEVQSDLSRKSHIVVPLVLSIPVLLSEGLASKKGLSILKKSGASKEVMKNAKKSLLSAWGTYALRPVMSLGLGKIAKDRSYMKEKKRLLDKKRKDDNI